MNGMDYTASLDEVLFADLTNDISSDGLFGNIIDACKTNGKLYSVPLTFQLSGICTDSKYVNDGQKIGWKPGKESEEALKDMRAKLAFK